MVKDIKHLATKLFNLLVCLFIFMTISLPLHESGHSLAAEAFGVPGHIVINWFHYSGWWTTPDYIPTFEYYVVAFAGGGFAAQRLVRDRAGNIWPAAPEAIRARL